MRNLILFIAILASVFVSAQDFNFNCNKYAPTIESVTRSDSDGDYVHGTTARFEIVAYDQDGPRPTLSYNIDGGELKSIEYFEGNEENHYYITYPLSSKGDRSLVVYASDGENNTTSTFSFEVVEAEEECVDAYSYEYLLYVATEVDGNIPSVEDCNYGPLTVFYLGDDGTTHRFSLLYFVGFEQFFVSVSIDTETEEVTIED